METAFVPKKNAGVEIEENCKYAVCTCSNVIINVPHAVHYFVDY